MSKYYSVFFFCLLFPVFIVAQDESKTPETLLHEIYGASRSEITYDLIENMEGGFVGAGSSQSKLNNGKKDLFFFITDKKGTLQGRIKVRGGTKDDAAHAIIQTFDGGYLMAGYSEASTGSDNVSPAGKNGWLLKVDEKGRTLWSRFYGSSGNDEFKDVIATDDGGFIAIGEKDQKPWILKLDAQGNVIWEETTPCAGQPTFARAGTLGKDGILYVTGYTSEENKNYLFLSTYDAEGHLVGDYKVYRDMPREGNDLTLDRDGFLLVTGSAMPARQNRMDAFYLKLDLEKNIIYQSRFGKGGNEIGQQIVSRLDGNLAIAGSTMTHRSRATRPQFWLRVADDQKEGEKIWDYTFGGKKAEEAFSVIETTDGYLVAAGYLTSKLVDLNTLVVKLNSNSFPTNPTPVALETKIQKVVYPADDLFLKENSRGYLQYQITNNGQEDALDITANVNCDNCKQRKVNYLSTIKLGSVKVGETKLFSIPFSTGKRIYTGTSNFKVVLTDKNKSQIDPLTFSIQVEEPPKPQLAISNAIFKTADGGSIGKRGQPIELQVDLTNTGKLEATNVRFFFHFEHKIVSLEEKEFSFTSLPPGASKRLTLNFKIDKNYFGNEVVITCNAVEKNPDRGAEKKYTLALIDYIEEPAREEPAREEPQVEPVREEPVREEPQVEPVITSTDTDTPSSSSSNRNLNVYWIEPSPETEKFDTVVSVVAFVTSSKPLNKKQFTIILNDEIVEGVKYDEDKILNTTENKDDFTLRYLVKVRLKEGKNEIRLRVKNEAGEKESKVKTITFSPERPDLHVYAIGIPYDKTDDLQNLNYTTNDAQDFAELMRNQHGEGHKLFANSYINVYTKVKETEVSEIRGIIEDIVTACQLGKIKRNDVLILFISAHGQVDDATLEFNLKASDFKRHRSMTTSVNFEEDIIARLRDLPIKKFILIDACNSGGAIDGAKSSDSNFSDSLFRLINAENGFKIMASCRSREYSYEDKKWENGAFTEAIITGFTKDYKKVDKDNDQSIDQVELYKYIKQKVPVLIKKDKPKAPTGQTPFMHQNHLKEKIPFYRIIK